MSACRRCGDPIPPSGRRGRPARECDACKEQIAATAILFGAFRNKRRQRFTTPVCVVCREPMERRGGALTCGRAVPQTARARTDSVQTQLRKSGRLAAPPYSIGSSLLHRLALDPILGELGGREHPVFLSRQIAGALDERRCKRRLEHRLAEVAHPGGTARLDLLW